MVEARAFFGFCPREDSTSVELTEAQQLLEERSCREIVAYFRAYRRRCKASDARVELRLHGASRSISRKCMAWLRRRRQANKERMKRREFYTRGTPAVLAGLLWSKGHLECEKSISAYLSCTANQVIGFQACYRGYKIRLVDPAGCLPAIRRLRAQLKKYRRDVASTTIQAAGRGVRARRRRWS